LPFLSRSLEGSPLLGSAKSSHSETLHSPAVRPGSSERISSHETDDQSGAWLAPFPTREAKDITASNSTEAGKHGQAMEPGKGSWASCPHHCKDSDATFVPVSYYDDSVSVVSDASCGTADDLHSNASVESATNFYGK
jgi:hypothetical protein